MRKRILIIGAAAALLIAGYAAGSKNAKVALANDDYAPVKSSVPKSFGKLVTAINDQLGTGLVFEDDKGVIHFVAMNGMPEGALDRYDVTPTHGGIPKAYGHLVAAVTNPNGTGLVFEDDKGVIRFLTLTGKLEGELDRK